MDTIEATKMVMSRIKTIDPQDASKIMGYLLIQHPSEHEIIRLAFGPENFLLSVIKQAKSFLDISSNTSSAPSFSSHFYHQTTPQIVIPNMGYNDDVKWCRPCMCFARGFCKNRNFCESFHGEMCLGLCSHTADFEDSTGVNVCGFDDFLRIKAMQEQEQRVVAMAAGGYYPFCFNKCINFFNEIPRSPPEAASLMMKENSLKFGRFRPDRHDLAAMGLWNSCSSSRQIYLTFSADSTFKDEDVSNYFSTFGPVQDVRIPYQQKRMFGFVSFVLAETVKSVLAKGNPHFVCDSHVLVKPYKEKGTIPFKKHQRQIARGDFSAFESAEPFDHIPFGARMFNHDARLRRNLAGQDECQQTIDIQERKLMNMRLTTEHQLQRSLSQSQMNPSLVHVNSLNACGEEIYASDTQELLTESSDSKEVNIKEINIRNSSGNGSYIHESVEHILPDNLFASPTKIAAMERQSIFSDTMPDVGGSANVNQTFLNMASLRSC
ncbi:putative RNA recognition motif domain, nucleotide-binding alpha-beta plait domain superfamily [Helianthus annuus]|uniref:zinc finger CCCH domain-containing protein 22 isoform X2 n=1 Tax=Helianthus annuus TaxID=4232 RepID=UPI001652E24C|nr:zinc finger CCCH domain-containing protein 22 isoform X2 [Helianthus annuus]KAJ0452002.1 putative RNA recognition motif domain, nucleotide-binding alpha-beta plait domain superfamily [Helianthus annuus]KAJ0456734.1 putative RNA recognition motif domain, nucleotide-binding alpha-beta plait domain superfamily [Helianthus annuus]KAJ0473885.1 putative RNA recognition motif domain, nucleotide-binding alpha-beta plait domain superfamily [Helianthus annuus]KAJ0649462.1 putative RNA recognition moti